MINKNSGSFPYLAVAQHYDVPYGDVLHFVGGLDQNHPLMDSMPEWQKATFAAWRREADRRNNPK